MNLKGFFAKRQPIAPAGLHHLAGGPVPAGKRVHLRVEQDGTGLLLIDASRVLHLNPTACDYAWLHLRGLGEAELLKHIRKHYRVSRRQAAADWAAIRETLDAMLGDSEVCPITFLGLDRIEPFQTPVSAPYRLDLALTYRCNIDCAHCYNERRECPELATDDWRRIMQKAWDAGVPHVVFTGGEATLRDDLRDLIAGVRSADQRCPARRP